MIKRPACLAAGDTVRVVVPALPVLAELPRTRARAEQALRELGLQVSYGHHAFAHRGHFAGTAEQRAADINDAFADDNVSAVLCALGGVEQIDILPHLDYDLIAENPKPCVGHSSNAAILLAITSRARVATFHGPSFINQFGEYPAPLTETVEGFKEACFGAEPLTFRPMSQRTDVVHSWWYDENKPSARERNLPGEWRWLVQGKAAGPLVGGVLFSLVGLVGTPWEPSFEGAILFFDVDQVFNPAIADGLLAELDRRGNVFDKVAGVIVGYPSRYVSPPHLAALHDVVLKWTEKVAGPVLVDADCGHTDPAWVLPIGVTAHLDSFNDTFRTEPGCSSPNRTASGSRNG